MLSCVSLSDSTHSVCPMYRRDSTVASRSMYCNMGLLHKTRPIHCHITDVTQVEPPATTKMNWPSLLLSIAVLPHTAFGFSTSFALLIHATSRTSRTSRTRRSCHCPLVMSYIPATGLFIGNSVGFEYSSLNMKITLRNH